MLPLTTEIVFPSEIECNKYACDMDDKVILFEEFPFGKQSNSEDLDLYAKRIGAGLCEVVLVLNDRKFMDSDISTEEMMSMENTQKEDSEFINMHGEICQISCLETESCIRIKIFLFLKRRLLR